jgi:hypothetical protein
MKIAVGAILTAALAFAAPAYAASVQKAAPEAPAPAAVAPASLDERLGCGVMLVTIDEVLQRNPQLAAKFSQGDKSSAAMMPLFRVLGASGGILLDKAYAEGVAQGQTPTVLYRRGVAELSSKFANGGGKEEAMAMFSRCMQVAAPES